MMRKLVCRLTSILTSILIVTTFVPAGTASAVNIAAYTYEMSILEKNSRRDTISVSTYDVAEGDVTLHLGIYIDSDEWEEYDYIEAVSANWESSDYSKIYFTNIADLAATKEQTTITYSGGEYTTRYEPYCFANVAILPKGAREMNRPISATTTKLAYDPIFGSEIHQFGYNQIQFSYSYYVSYEDKEQDLAENTRNRMQTRDCVCDVQYSDTGLAYYEYSYIRQDTYEVDTAVGYLPMYDPELEVGTTVPGLCNFMMWLYKGSSKTSFFGESSDEFPMITFDAVIKQGTPAGMYSINFLSNDKTFMNGVTSKSHQPASANGLTIIVDDNAPRITEPVETTTVPQETTVTETTAVTNASDVTDIQTTISSEATTQTVTQDTEDIVTVPAITPMFLEDGCTMYVNDEKSVLIYNAGSNPIAWILSSQNVVSLDGTDGAYAYFTAMEPGTVTLYAVVGGKACPYEITVLADDDAYLCGDVNRDGTISLIDVLLLMKYMSGSTELDYYARENADCNDNNTLDLEDVVVLQEFLIRMLSSIPSEPI